MPGRNQQEVERVDARASERRATAKWLRKAAAAGKCSNCGTGRPDEGKKTCPRCLGQAKDRYWKGDGLTARLAVKRRREELRRLAFDAYGGARCSCCSESVRAFLTIDHVGGGGNRHRRDIGNDSAALYRWLNRTGYPDGFRVLCWNCNWGTHVNGGVCPHQSKG